MIATDTECCQYNVPNSPPRRSMRKFDFMKFLLCTEVSKLLGAYGRRKIQFEVCAGTRRCHDSRRRTRERNIRFSVARDRRDLFADVPRRFRKTISNENPRHPRARRLNVITNRCFRNDSTIYVPRSRSVCRRARGGGHQSTGPRDSAAGLTRINHTGGTHTRKSPVLVLLLHVLVAPVPFLRRHVLGVKKTFIRVKIRSSGVRSIYIYLYKSAFRTTDGETRHVMSPPAMDPTDVRNAR